MKNKIFKAIIIFIIIASLFSCEIITLLAHQNDPVFIFDTLWQEFDRYYGSFIHKNIDWDALYSVYRPMINSDTSDDRLFSIISDLLGELNDKHIRFYGGEDRLYNSGMNSIYVPVDFDIDVVKNNYLTEPKTSGDNFTYGMLTSTTGYIHIKNFWGNDSQWYDRIDSILSYLENTENLIIDVRDNRGGMNEDTEFLAGRFTTSRIKYRISRFRNGPEHNDFTKPYSYYIEPKGNIQYTKPIVVLCDDLTMSCGELFILAMKETANAEVIGDYTAGAMCTILHKELPNGWYYIQPTGIVTDAKGNCYEGTGITPDVIIKNTEEDIAAGTDTILETAINRLNPH